MPQLEIHGVKVHYNDVGKGPVVLLVHAATNHGGQWDQVRQAMGDDFRFLLPDLFDSGKSDPWPLLRALTFDDEADIILAAMAQTDQPVHLAGHSYGGAVALRAAVRCPRRVRSLCLIEPGGAPLLREAGRQADYDEYVGVMKRFLASVDAGEQNDAWRDFLNYYRGSAKAWSGLDAETQARILAKTESQRQVYAAQMNNPTTIAELRDLTVPTLVVTGSATTAPERGVSLVLQDHLPNASLHIVQGAGHPMPLSHPMQLGQALSRHVGAVEQKSQTVKQ